MFKFLFSFILILSTSEALVKVSDIDRSAVNQSGCVSVKSLENLVVQRGLGESRKIRKIAVHITGSGIIDLDLSIATEFRNSDYNSPIFHRCGNYFGKIEDAMISTDCLEDGHPEGYEGLAVYARFHGDIDPSLMVCRMEIVLHDKLDDQRKEIIHGTIVITSVICTVIILAGVGIYAWFTWGVRTEAEKLLDELEQPEDHDEEVEVYLEENFAVPENSEDNEVEQSQSELINKNDESYGDDNSSVFLENLGSIETYID